LQDGDTIDLGETVRLRFMDLSFPAAAAASVDVIERPTQLYTPPAQPVAVRPSPAPRPPPAAIPAPPAPVPPAYTLPPAYEAQQPRRGRGWLTGCGLVLAMLLVCAGVFLVLDAYDQGRLLYCGPLNSFFELILGPFGFAPICP
jgi:hypothetical protein